MSERKNIDRLFQEKFKDFEVAPPQEAWANIEAKLDGKKKRRVIPFWWKLSGVAAVFLIGFLIFKSISNGGLKTENAVVNTNNPTKKEQTIIKGLNEDNRKIRVENSVVNEENSNKSNTEEKLKNNGSDSGSNTVVNADNEIKSNAVSDEKNKKTKVAFSSKSTVAERKSSDSRSMKNKSNSVKVKTLLNESVFEKSQDQVAQNQKNDNQLTADKNIVQTDLKEKNNKQTQTKSDKSPINLDDLKGNVNSKIATKEIEKKVNDTAKKNSVANNVLEELLNEKESKVKLESKKNRWQLTSNVAPIFLGSFTNGSPIDSILSKNSKSYNTNVGYGIGVSYAVNKKLSVRTGLNKVNMSYNTNDILFFTGLQSKMLENVRPTASSKMIHVQSASSSVSATSENGLLPFENTFSPENKGSLNQQMGYLEIPLEMTYSLFDKKFGLKIIGGFSTLFLQDNKITILSEGRDTVLGEADNLNNIHFSTNLGLGIKYGFMKSFEFNIEPTVKYQLNTFSSNAGNFKPYLFGVYSGISYKF
ncbi:MAG TPA: hypothetical protein PKN96_01015 [Flavobacterium sp.]|uniref:hypothetical protein n=1 Tax=Flavobacterium sp. TaxID=239 RepID=UPI002C397CA8|nr:hypothetical protein [Flavobacterium sp.]HNP31852.1 hypothetical protein [Flavobacterium sp.]